MKELNLLQFESCTFASKQAKGKIHSSTNSSKTNTVNEVLGILPQNMVVGIRESNRNGPWRVEKNLSLVVQ